MKRVLALTTAALMSGSLLAAPVLAQDSDATPGTMEMENGATSPANPAPDAPAAVDPGTTQAVEAPSFDGVMRAIEGNSASATAIGSMSEINDVNVVSVSELSNFDTSEANQVVSANSAGIEELKSSIEGNSALSQELQSQGVDLSKVVAAEVTGTGVVLYVM
ncbi:hypothetical protein [Aquamicrobium sp. LC103]|uniref:hypothetical protein n=1 Tax=Aquamicrobium sp. LC103 TaxID=1120658 RepID=UPI00063E7D40|nr:hypothetical protein [Aquamicrobium sp. LC103]TKT82508.1 hypothetical protein XW59_000655 [Aquamicrobium sp. LC103]